MFKKSLQHISHSPKYILYIEISQKLWYRLLSSSYKNTQKYVWHMAIA